MKQSFGDGLEDFTADGLQSAPSIKDLEAYVKEGSKALSENRLIEALDFFNCVLDGRVRQGAEDSKVIAQAAGFDRPFINSHPF